MTALKNFALSKPALFASILGGLTLLAAFVSEYGFGLHPCEMCWWQRYPYMIALIVTAGFTLAGKDDHASLLWLLCLLFAGNAVIAGFHVGVEQKWWQGITTCAAGGGVSSVEDMLKAIKEAALVRCDEIQFSLFGISMAGYNFLITLSLAGFTLWSLRRRAS